MIGRLVSLMVLASIAFATSARADVKTVTATIDMSKPDSAVEEIMQLSNALAGSEKMVYLNLTILPAVNEGKYTYPVDRIIDSSGSTKTVKCDNGWERFSGATRQFVFNFNSVYNHFLLSVWHAGPLQAPYSTIACEYSSQETPGLAKFVVRGYFVKSSLSVPTAIEMELRPISP